MEKKIGGGLKGKKQGEMCELWGIPLFGRGRGEVLEEVRGWLARGKRRQWVATVNPEFVMAAVDDRDFGKILKQGTDMNVVDGVGVAWGMEVKNKGKVEKLRRLFDIFGGRYEEKVVAGSQLVADFCQMAKKCNYRVFFLGGWGDRAKRTAEFFEGKYKGLEVGWCRGMPEVKNDRVLEQINKFKPHFLLVAYGMKKQEEWVDKNLEKLDVGVVMGVGRSFDYWSGDLKRAPRVWRKMGLEWLYSLIQEPRRWRRQLALPRFVGKVIFG